MDTPTITLKGGALDGTVLTMATPHPGVLLLEALIDGESDEEAGLLHLAKPGTAFPRDVVDPNDIWRYTYGKSGPTTYLHIHTEVAPNSLPPSKRPQ